MAAELVRVQADEEGMVAPVLSYLVLYTIVHTLWHAEDLVHTRHVNALPPPPPAATIAMVNGGLARRAIYASGQLAAAVFVVMEGRDVRVPGELRPRSLFAPPPTATYHPSHCPSH